MTIPKFIKFTIYLLVNFGLLYLYKVVFDLPLRIVETLIIVSIGSLICFSIFSIVTNPNQFFKALKERLIRPFALVFVIVVRIFVIFISLFLRIIKLVIAIVVIIVYGVSPIDLIPDLILGLGWLDDIAVTLLALYWGLTFGKIAMSSDLREFAKGLNEETKIKTKFPY